MRKYLFRFGCAITLLCVLMLNSRGISVLYASPVSKIITAIETEGLSRIDEDELINLICNCTGSELDMTQIRNGIRRAFKKGIFLDIKVVSEPYNDGMKLKYIVKELPVIEKITIEGNEYFIQRQLKKIFYFKKGDDFRTEYLDRARMSIVNFYERKGFPDAKVDIAVNKLMNESAVNIHIKIDEGKPVLIQSVTTSGDSRFLVTLSAGEIFDKDEMESIIKKLKKYYKGKKYINPSVGPYEFADGELVIPVAPGARLEVAFQNNTVISTRKLRKKVNYLENEEVSDELTAEIAERIRDLYIREGYYYAQVAAGTEEKDDVIRVTFIIFEGRQVILRGIRMNGVSINENAVNKVLSIPVNKPFNNNLLAGSRESLIRFYHALGYLDVEVPDIKKHFNEDGTELDLEIDVVEGTQKRIAGIEITGNNTIGVSKILGAIKIKKDLPYNRVDVRDARYRILSFYGQNGYMDARVDVESIVDGEKVFIKFIITENKPSIIGKIILRGNSITKAKIIKRELTLEEGERYDSDEVTKIKQNLYKLGLFNEVAIDMLETGRTSDGGVVKDMLVSLKESNAGSIEFSFGYGDYEKFRGALDIRYKNIGGYNRQIGFRTELSSVEKRYVLNFKEPWLFNNPDLPLKIFLVKEDTRSVSNENRNVLYKIDKLSFIAGVEKELMKGLKVGLNYEYSFTDTKDVQPGVILSKEDTGKLGIGSISTSLFYDTRDDPFDPTSGSKHGVTFKFASVAFLSEIEFMKGSFQSAWFFPLHKKIVFAFSLRGGVAYSYEDTEELPLIERFFLGGRSSVRGYEHDALGPKGEDNSPTGGNVFALINNEFRFTLGKGLGLVTFVDAGNVWRTIDEIGSELKYTLGTGIRYKTPVGPVRLDYGHKLDREPGESSGEVHFSFGHIF